jgi:hypothetical protein
MSGPTLFPDSIGIPMRQGGTLTRSSLRAEGMNQQKQHRLLASDG